MIFDTTTIPKVICYMNAFYFTYEKEILGDLNMFSLCMPHTRLKSLSAWGEKSQCNFSFTPDDTGVLKPTVN